MRWDWKNEPFDPATATPEELAAAHRLEGCGRSLGIVLGLVAAAVICFVWESFGSEIKWVEYTLLPSVIIGGCLVYRLVYEFVIRFRL